MPVILDFLYREYCRARLAEMRKQLLIRTQNHESSEANCDASHLHHTIGETCASGGVQEGAPTGQIGRSLKS